MVKKALYKHKKTGDLFAIETDGSGNVLFTSGLLLTKGLNPEADRSLNPGHTRRNRTEPEPGQENAGRQEL